MQGSDYFAIRYVFGPKGTSKAVISLVKEVDYERRNVFPMTVIAMVCRKAAQLFSKFDRSSQNAWTNETIDTRNVATMDIIIVVKDADDTPPKFVDLPSVVQIPEELLAVSQIDAERIRDDNSSHPGKRNSESDGRGRGLRNQPKNRILICTK